MATDNTTSPALAAEIVKSVSNNWGVYGALTRDYLEHYETFLEDQYYALQTSIVPEWPGRLLHVPSMTSIERSEGNMYGEDTEPEYNALSYKWGLFVVDDGPRLEVKGINWRIPAVDQNRFTVRDLQRVLLYMTKDVDYVWLDVACVDQGVPSETIAEIKKEPGIFKNAKQAFIWLNGFTPLEFETMMAHFADSFPCDSLDYPDYTLETARNLQTLFRNLWFQSVWTLREILARWDALILDQNGEPSYSIQLHHIVSRCRKFLYLVQKGRVIVDPIHDPTFRPRSPENSAVKSALIKKIRTIIEDAGAFFLFCGDPGEVYRETSYLLTKAEDIAQGTQITTLSSHAKLTALCRCDPSEYPYARFKCTPCILGISCKQGDIEVSRYYLSL